MSEKNDKTNEIEKQIDISLKALSLITKVGLLIGGVCIVFYLLINGHYPQGVSIGDGLLFLIAAICFGAAYLIFTGLMTTTGILISPILIPILKTCLRISNKANKQQSDFTFELQKISLLSFIFGSIGAIFIFFLVRKNTIEHITLLILPIFQYLMYSAYLDQNKKIKSAAHNSSNSATTDAPTANADFDVELIKKIRLMIGGFIVITPLIFGGMTTDLLTIAMKAAKVRIDNANINVKMPYANLLPSPTASKLDQFKRFENVTIVFRGVGNTTLVEMRTPESNTRLEIPNDSIVIENYKSTSPKVAKN